MFVFYICKQTADCLHVFCKQTADCLLYFCKQKADCLLFFCKQTADSLLFFCKQTGLYQQRDATLLKIWAWECKWAIFWGDAHCIHSLLCFQVYVGEFNFFDDMCTLISFFNSSQWFFLFTKMYQFLPLDRPSMKLSCISRKINCSS